MKIQQCPIPFHDRVELLEFLENLPPRYLYMFDGLRVFYHGLPFLVILIFYVDGLYRISLKRYKL